MTVKETLQRTANNRKADITKRNEELDKIKARLDELEKINETSKDEEELKAAGEELDALKAKKAELEAEIAEKQAELDEVNAQIAELDKPVDDQGQRNKLGFMKREERNGGQHQMNIEERTQRAEEFKKTGKKSMETRSVLVSGGTIATPTGVDGITDTFNTVSSIVDLVKVVDCKGMSSNKIAYMTNGSTADIKAEGSAAATGEPTFAFTTITPVSVGLVSYVSDQVRKQSPLNYEAKVNDAAKVALRTKAAAIITDAIVGSSLNATVKGAVTSGKGAIAANTLRQLVLAYGGNENVEGNAYLFLNKADLIALGDIRGANEKKAVFEIVPNASNPNTGVIKDGGLAVNYCINSNCAAFNGTTQPATTGKDLVTMFYGQPTNCELDLFGDYEIRVSDDYKFAENLLTIRGQVDAGAGVIKKDGFVALVLPKATA